jgi:23S rRNA-/tRNA-specific pseudouridylate synthase
VPLHRLDRLTAGLVLFSTQRASRDAYQRLFRERRIEKTYEAWHRRCPGWSFRCSGTAAWCRASRSSAWPKCPASQCAQPDRG